MKTAAISVHLNARLDWLGVSEWMVGSNFYIYNIDVESLNFQSFSKFSINWSQVTGQSFFMAILIYSS